ncbi:non-specific lipid transfer protein GPI-anchored 9-like [Prosopis cineraria]|uniref:non-specific lipid transfer protein GPI-anchored 9-like n=1 Tax=Prosopis cineraria TaxID=364024 RepID=UPI00240EFB0B|nr:non-specific lipid transfer protein GPI-anchored 9-like [Prosopis cineraria]
MKMVGSKGVSVLLVLLIVVRSFGAEGQNSQCTSTFFSALVQLIPCRLAVAPFSSVPPSDACCNALKALGQPCLCVIANGPPISGVDRNMALQLPERCTANFEPCDIMK